MVIVGLALSALAAFVALTRAAGRGSRIARVGALVEGAVLLCLSAGAVVVALTYLSLGCDDHCVDDGFASGPGRWWESAQAWQWWGQFVLCLLGAAAVAAGFVAAKRARYRRGVALLACATVWFGGWVALLAPVASAASN